MTHRDTPLLDLSSFEKAVATLERALRERREKPKDEYVRDACIQRFEYCYELSHKMLRRFLEMTESTPGEADAMSFPTLIRTACEKNLSQGDWPQWKEYRKIRNLTGHTYDEAVAEEVCEALPGFLLEAQDLLKRLRRRLAETEER